VNWMSVDGSHDFSGLTNPELKRLPGARRWDAAEPGSFSNLSAVEGSLDFILRIGVDEIVRINRELQQEIIDRLPRDRYVLASPASADERGPYVCIQARKTDETAAVHKKLIASQVIVALRENAIRISPYLFNTSDHITRLVKALSVA
jgi:selenocysteine lyase/cysteine desulfurase